MQTCKKTCINVFDITNLPQHFKAVYLLLQCCLSNISTTMNDRYINNYIWDVYKYFRQDQQEKEPRGCLLAAAGLFVKNFNNNE